MSWRERFQWANLALCFVALFSYATIWFELSASQIRHTDFVAGYSGGLLVRLFGGDNLYDLGWQNGVFAHVVSPEKLALLPFTWAPPVATLLAPLSWFPLLVGFRVESLLALFTLVAAVAVVVKIGFAPADRAFPAALALAGLPTFYLLIQGQLVGLTALGIAVAYRSWRKGDLADGALWLGFLLAAVKPHLALGIAVFLLGWGEWVAIRSALLGALAAVVLALLVVGGPGTMGFVSSSLFTANVWPLPKMVTLTGLATSLLGSNSVGVLSGLVLSIAGLSVCFVAGRKYANGQWSLEIALAICCVLTVVASPHAYVQDLAVAAMALPLLWIRIAKSEGGVTALQCALVILAWLVPNALAGFILGSNQGYTGVLMPIGIAGAAVLMWLATNRGAVATGA